MESSISAAKSSESASTLERATAFESAAKQRRERGIPAAACTSLPAPVAHSVRQLPQTATEHRVQLCALAYSIAA